MMQIQTITTARKSILEHVRQHPHGVTPADAEQYLLAMVETSTDEPLRQRRHKTRHKIHRGARRIIRDLVDEGILGYADHLGRTVIVPGMDRPVAVSRRIILTKAGMRAPVSGDTVTICLHSGPSFGNGTHPTTRMALTMIDALMVEPFCSTVKNVLDIGTGTGILAMAALLLSSAQGVGVDIDDFALYESARNATLNGLGNRLKIQRDLPEMHGRCQLILANLRTPTLIALAPEIRRLSAPSAVLILSGMRASEASAVIGAYEESFSVTKIMSESDWSAISLQTTG